MTDSSKKIVVTLESVLESVELAEEIALNVAAAAGFEDEDRHKLGMSVREGVINALVYGNQMAPEKKAVLTLSLKPDKLEIIVLDQGAGFSLDNVPDPLAEENILKSSGRGILLMRSFMDEFEVGSGPQGGAKLRMAMRYRNPPPPASTSGPGAKERSKP